MPDGWLPIYGGTTGYGFYGPGGYYGAV